MAQIPQRAYRVDKKGSDIDRCYTPPEAVEIIIPFLRQRGIEKIWECASGSGLIAYALRKAGFSVMETDIEYGFDFLVDEPDFEYDAIVTNFPFGDDYKFAARCMATGKPWLAIMKDNRNGVKRFREAIGWKKRNGYWVPPDGLQKIIPSKRICYKMPEKGWFTIDKKTGELVNNSAQFATYWWAYDLQLPSDEICVEYRQLDRLSLKHHLDKLGISGRFFDYCLDHGIRPNSTMSEDLLQAKLFDFYCDFNE